MAKNKPPIATDFSVIETEHDNAEPQNEPVRYEHKQPTTQKINARDCSITTAPEVTPTRITIISSRRLVVSQQLTDLSAGADKRVRPKLQASAAHACKAPSVYGRGSGISARSQATLLALMVTTTVSSCCHYGI